MTTIHAQISLVATDLNVTTYPDNVLPIVVTLPDGTKEHDATINGRAYRQLTPTYFAWLRSKMLDARARYGRRQLPEARWNVLRERFNDLQDLAVSLYGEEALTATIDACTPEWIAAYVPPTAQMERSGAVGAIAGQSSGTGKSSVLPPTAESLYAKDIDAITPDDRRAIFGMMERGTWNPPHPLIDDPYAPEQTLALAI